MTLRGFTNHLRQLRDDRGGNIAILFALALVPMLGLIGMAMDYTRAVRVKASMHAAVDATALMMAREASKLTPEQLQAKATAYFTANFKNPEGKNLKVTPVMTTPAPGRWTLTITATGKVDTMVMRWPSYVPGSGVTAPSQLDVGSTSTVNWGMKKLELALALDNTLSMASSNKMTELKKAVKTLLTTLKAAEKVSGDIKISIIPFETQVRIGTAFKDKPWFDLSLCKDYELSDTQCAQQWKTYWDGCVQDRTYPYDTQDTKPDSGNKPTLYPISLCSGELNKSSSLTEALPLTADWTKLTAKVDQMTPAGSTNVTIGLVWAWHSLTKQDAFDGAADPASDLDKVIILLTDGENTRAWKNSTRDPVTSTSSIDARTKATCDNLRTTGIKVYTVRVIDGDAGLLRDCATKTDMYYNVQQASDLNAVFTAIADSLANLYIAK